MRIAAHHARDEWQPLLAWPEDCYVQWGGNGIVLRKESRGGSYNAAFFEAFPEYESKRGGFIRGQGDTVESAEAAAFAAFLRADACDHRFGRRGYTNAGGFCTKCGHFASVFQPIVELGAWKRPISYDELSFALGGWLCPDPGMEDGSRFRRRLLLRLRAAGMAIPDPVPRTRPFGGPEVEDWVRRTRPIVRRWLVENGGMDAVEKPDDGNMMEDLLRSLDGRQIERLLAQTEDVGERA